jgi:glutamate-1-semialdehyde 2,1-aminomutase
VLRDRTRSLAASADLWGAARRVIPGGVGSNDRQLVQPHPIFISHGAGSRMYDLDGNEYIDYLLGYGPLVLGHAHPAIVEAVSVQAARGTIFGAGHELELRIAERLVQLMPSIDMVRFSQSGNEAVLTAMRLARAATGRSLIIKFEGQYHGWTDQVAISYAPPPDEAGPLEHPNAVPMSAGQSVGAYDDLLVLPWNDTSAAEQAFAERGNEIAGVLTEPIMCNFGVLEPLPGFLESLRALCDQYSAVLIFDEVQTGLRVHLQGAQGLFGITPDLTCMGKALSGGFPVSAIGGRSSIMELISSRRVFHAGTYNTNPLCLASVEAVLQVVSEPGVYAQMERLSTRLRNGIAALVAPIGGYVQGTTTLFGIGFGMGPITSMRDGWSNDWSRIMDLKRELWLRGVYTKPTPRDIWWVSTAHSDNDVDETLEVVAEAVNALG